MSLFFYQIFIRFYLATVYISSLFNPKAKKWVNGRRNIFEQLKNTIPSNEKIYWFHCASLGEFEQGKPIIDYLKIKNDRNKILITFFSPSGYELRKDYENADYVFYLPMDTKKNAQKFIEITKPTKAFFIKYEFWYNYLFELNQHHVPTYLISGVFRKQQPFFKWYGGTHRKMLTYFEHFFVQNIRSENLLKKLGHNNVSTAGDTRIDRVYENSTQPTSIPLIKTFKGNKKIIIVGSSWQKEEEIIAEFIHSSKKDYKFIIAPHDVSDSRIQEIKKLLQGNYIKYSDANSNNIKQFKVLIIDNIGLLSNIYQYTDIAFIGGGFTGSLHNILEPASFGNTLLFGPKHHQFHEAEELIQLAAAYEIKDADDLLAVLNHLELDNQLITSQASSIKYIQQGVGATKMIINKLKL
ncbi:MAG: 3-deoxy-D-manno-octulosonic acid transferase [Vicingus serpentipes]|nr:3-deoxy-D-manno-octulosonic acid transferase [Vicingus serpentipes]